MCVSSLFFVRIIIDSIYGQFHFLSSQENKRLKDAGQPALRRNLSPSESSGFNKPFLRETK